jgi:hypothetical protein
MTFVNHIESIVSKSVRMLGFIKRISREFSDPYTNKTLNVAFFRPPGLEYMHQEVHSARIERIQHNFIRFALRGLGWTTQPLPPYESRCLLLGLEVLSDRRKIAAALFVRDILYGRNESTYLVDLLLFESNSCPRRRNARLMDSYHRTNYGQNVPANKAIWIFNEYCDLFS